MRSGCMPALGFQTVHYHADLRCYEMIKVLTASSESTSVASSHLLNSIKGIVITTVITVKASIVTEAIMIAP